jgi:hypothetical protein
VKLTMSRDGRRRGTLRVEHRVDADTLAANLCLAVVKNHDVMDEGDLGDSESVPKNPSQTWILNEVRTVLKQRGSDAADWWADDVSDEAADEIRVWADAAVRGAFPEFDR